MLDRSKYTELLKKYLDGSISAQEHDELFMMSASNDVDDLLLEEMDTELKGKGIEGTDLPPHVAEEILRNILSSEKNTTKIVSLFPTHKKVVRWLSAAVIAGLVIIAGAYYWGKGGGNADSISRFAALIPNTDHQTINHSLIPLIVHLEDGSEVILKHNATIHYPVRFAENKREVYLTGEAFFKISKNPNRPFLVYCNNIITRVLGTSFTVKPNSQTNHVEVVVCTGKVQVFENSRLVNTNATAQSVIVTPNQKAIYDGEQRSFETTLADSLQVVVVSDKVTPTVKQQESLVFTNATTVKDIFSQLERLYGIEIVVDNENIYNCVFKGDLSRQNVYNKLSIVCLAVDASYEIKGTRILVSGKGCN
jgi:transmembrane sensor